MNISLIDYIFIISGLIYVLFIIIQKRFRISSLVVSMLPLSLIFFRSRDIYFPILSLISVLQAFFFIKKRTPSTASKYFLYSFLFLLCGSAVTSSIYKEMFIIIIAIKALFSDQTLEIDNTDIFHSNMLITLSALLNLQGPNSKALHLIVLGIIALACFRSIFDSRLKAPIYISSIFILLATTHPVYAGCIFIYALIFHSISEPKDRTDQILILTASCLPFLDNTLFQIVTPFIHLKWVLPSLAVLTAISFSFYIENVEVNKRYKIRFGKLFLVIFPLIVLSSFNIIWSPNLPTLNMPIPLIACIVLILFNGLYLKVSQRIKIGTLLPSITSIKARKTGGTRKGAERSLDSFYINYSYLDNIISKSGTGTLLLMLMISLMVAVACYRWLA